MASICSTWTVHGCNLRASGGTCEAGLLGDSGGAASAESSGSFDLEVQFGGRKREDSLGMTTRGTMVLETKEENNSLADQQNQLQFILNWVLYMKLLYLSLCGRGQLRQVLF